MAVRHLETTMEVDWSSLHTDVLRVIGDLLLVATNDVDSYVDMRAVCNNWQAAIPKPTTLGAGDDHRFRPREWVILDEKKPNDVVGGRLFLNLSTGRFLRRSLPQLDDAILVGASNGLLVLGDLNGPHAARLLNPFTRDVLRFFAPIPQENGVRTSAVAGCSPTLLFSFDDWVNHRKEVVYCADTTSHLCEVHFGGSINDEAWRNLVSYDGNHYVVDYHGRILRIVGRAPNYRSELIAKIYNDDWHFFLVESAGKLLLVTTQDQLSDAGNAVEVFAVDIERKLLEPVRNIGSRALFLGARCLSVDADKLPTVDGNCIYYVDYPNLGATYDSINRYDLGNSYLERISCVSVPGSRIRIRPFSIAQTLLEYCLHLPSVKKQVERHPWSWHFG